MQLLSLAVSKQVCKWTFWWTLPYGEVNMQMNGHAETNLQSNGQPCVFEVKWAPWELSCSMECHRDSSLTVRRNGVEGRPWCVLPGYAVSMRCQCGAVSHPEYFVGSLWAQPICQQEWNRTPARCTGSTIKSVVTMCPMMQSSWYHRSLSPAVPSTPPPQGSIRCLSWISGSPPRLLCVASPERSSLHLFMATL